MIIGITGGSGSGKTTALNAIRELGGTVLDCDAIYHELLKSDKALLQKIENRFPGTVENGVLDRKKLGSIVFSDTGALKELNRITHKAVVDRVEALLPPVPELAAIDAIALFESGLDQLCQYTVAITAPKDERIARLMVRDGISREYAQLRIEAQRDDQWFRNRSMYTLENTGTESQFYAKCLAFFEELVIMDLEPR